MEATATIAIAAALALGLASIGAALGQGRMASAALEGMARNPKAAGELRTSLLLTLAIMELAPILGFALAMTVIRLGSAA